MTKVSVLGGEHKRDLKKIELVKFITSTGSCLDDATMRASDFKEVVLIKTNALERGCFDLILAKSHSDKVNDTIFLGHWNDGVV